MSNSLPNEAKIQRKSMGILGSLLNRLTTTQKNSAQTARPLPPPEPEEDEIAVPEIMAAELSARLKAEKSLLLLDIREQYEWNQVRMPGAQHIPMNSIPARLDELPKEQEIIVLCAHGQRSYGVAHYLLENGFNAASLDGGMTDWAAHGYEVAVGPPDTNE